MASFNESHIKRVYDINLEDIALLFERQDSCCAICENFGPSLELVVDHKHRVNKKSATPHDVRGLLCPNCNKGLGLFRDDTYLIKTAIDYLAYFEEKGFPWDYRDRCLICEDTGAKLFIDKRINTQNWIGDMCHHCLMGLTFFDYNQHSLRRAIAYLCYYNKTPNGAFWRPQHNHPAFPHGIPYEFLYGEWKKVRHLVG